MTSPARPKLPPAVWWFGATSFANDLASEMVYPWMYQVLGGDVALRASAIVTLAATVLLGAVSLLRTDGAARAPRAS